MPQHTPGPWSVKGNSAQRRVRVVGGPTGEWGVCTVHALLDQNSNARLIAAAPDMLAALRTIAPFLYQLQNNPDLLPETRAVREGLAEAVRTAIAKATTPTA